tara:strand:+ start:3183 stop:3434 length:252 start_codon:yes stop_codon:yes gene_type:complete
MADMKKVEKWYERLRRECQEIETRASVHESNAAQILDEIEIPMGGDGPIVEATMAAVEATLAVATRLESLGYAIREVADAAGD